MPEDQDNEESKTSKRKKTCVWLGIIVVLMLIIICSLLSLTNSKSADEKLAEIEAARAIPDSENAAVVYNQMLDDPNASIPIDHRPEFLDDESFSQTTWEPWLTKDYPQLAAWIQTYRSTIERLLEACALEECRFPIVIDAQQLGQSMRRQTVMRKWGYLLRFAANNDIAEGRTDDAIAKWRCLVRMGEHLRQQPSQMDHLIAFMTDSIALQLSAVYIVEGDAIETRLRQIESIRLDTKDDWAGYAEQIRIVQDLTMQKLKEEFGPIDHVMYLLNYGIYGILKPSTPDLLHKHHLRHTASRRGNHILIALRRYKNKHGAWPESLDEIRPHILPEALIDPFNDGPFIYRLTNSGFGLYSAGKNKLDEDGKPRDPFDDWPIWPLFGMQPKPEQKNTNTQIPDPNTDQSE